MKHKIVCWGDYAIPVPQNHTCMAWDRDGRFFTYKNTPSPNAGIGVWANTGGGMDYGDAAQPTDVIPPEPGPWHTQLYDITRW